MMLPIIFYGIIFFFMLVIGICSACLDYEADQRQIGAIVALTSFVWPVWILLGLWTFIHYLIRTALGKD